MRRYKIGRSETNEIVIADASVSRHHADLAERGGGLFSLTDLGSTYGTQVWRGETWSPAAETEIRPDTVIRFGEFQTTLRDLLSETQRAALGISPAPASPQPTPVPAAPAADTPAAPRTAPPPRQAPPEPPAPPAAAAAPEPPRKPPPIATPVEQAAPVERASPVEPAPPAPRTEQRVAPARAEPPLRAARLRPAASGSRRRSLLMGLLGIGVFVAIAAIAVAAVVLLGNADPPPRPDTPGRTDTAEAQARILDSCTKQWGVEERRCRCFLSAAGPHLLAEDYEDFAAIVEAYVSGDADRQESALQRATEKRGAPANSRLTASFKGVVRDCQQ